MNHGSLFSGGGGFDLASEWMGWNNVFHCEIEPFPRKILNYYWPNSISYEDITKTDFTIHRGQIDIITGGFPCQPYSVAGKRKGKEDSRHLWPEMLRAIREVQPTWVIGENVSGLINWNDGLVFNEVQTDLETQGYEVQPYILPAASVNAPHKRDRIWFVAYSHNNRTSRASRQNEGKSQKKWLQKRHKIQQFNFSNHLRWNATNPNGKRWNHGRNYREERHLFFNQKWNTPKSKPTRNQRKCGFSEIGSVWNATHPHSKWRPRLHHQSQATRTQKGSELFEGLHRVQFFTHPQCCRRLQVLQNAKRRQPNGYKFDPNFKPNDWAKFPTQPPLCNGNDGISTRLDGITFPKWRAESIKLGGNAIVPQVALNIFKSIELFTEKIKADAIH